MNEKKSWNLDNTDVTNIERNLATNRGLSFRKKVDPEKPKLRKKKKMKKQTSSSFSKLV